MIEGTVAGVRADDPAVLRVLVAIHGDEAWGADEPGRGAEHELPVPRRGEAARDRAVAADPRPRAAALP